MHIGHLSEKTETDMADGNRKFPSDAGFPPSPSIFTIATGDKLTLVARIHFRSPPP
jgi:hypothetical protein